jgi:ABC-type branched-subunit amino acid transport system ATPase component
MPLADRVVVLDHGRVIATGTSHDIAKDAQVVEAYLGQPLTSRSRSAVAE